MIQNLNSIINVKISQNSELAAPAKKSGGDIFDFDLKTVQLGSGQPRTVITSKSLCTPTCPTGTGNSFCCTCRH